MERQYDRGAGQQEDVAAESDPAYGDPGRTRRSLLARAASGFALAASGLYLPDGQDEAEAKGPSGRLGDRTRSRKRKRRHNRRRKKNDKNNDKNLNRDHGKGSPAIDDGLRFRVFNGLTDEESRGGLRLQFWRDEFDEGVYTPGALTTLPPCPWSEHNEAIYLTPWSDAFLWLNDRYFVEAWNPEILPVKAKLGLGGSVDRHGGGWSGGQVKVEETLHVGGTLRFSDDESGVTVVIRRNQDYEDKGSGAEYKDFEVWIGKGQGPS